MYPTLNHKDRVLINHLAYNMQSIHRNDIISIKTDNQDKQLVKRVIGLPGATLTIRMEYFI